MKYRSSRSIPLCYTRRPNNSRHYYAILKHCDWNHEWISPSSLGCLRRFHTRLRQMTLRRTCKVPIQTPGHHFKRHLDICELILVPSRTRSPIQNICTKSPPLDPSTKGAYSSATATLPPQTLHRYLSPLARRSPPPHRLLTPPSSPPKPRPNHGNLL